jgi:hypothetical protein
MGRSKLHQLPQDFGDMIGWKAAKKQVPYTIVYLEEKRQNLCVLQGLFYCRCIELLQERCGITGSI